MAEDERRPYKRRRVAATDEQEGVLQPAASEQDEPIQHLLYIRWFGGQGQTKLNKLPLRQIDTLQALEVGSSRYQQSLATHSSHRQAMNCVEGMVVEQMPRQMLHLQPYWCSRVQGPCAAVLQHVDNSRHARSAAHVVHCTQTYMLFDTSCHEQLSPPAKQMRVAGIPDLSMLPIMLHMFHALSSCYHTQELPKELVESHYPTTQQQPDYFTNTAYIRFTPEVDCLALPGGCPGPGCAAVQLCVW